MKLEDQTINFSKFASYAELRDYGLKCHEGSKLWFEWLSLKRQRDEAIAGIIKQTRKKRPGLANYEIVKMYQAHIDKNFPLYTWIKVEEQL